MFSFLVTLGRSSSFQHATSSHWTGSARRDLRHVVLPCDIYIYKYNMFIYDVILIHIYIYISM